MAMGGGGELTIEWIGTGEKMVHQAIIGWAVDPAEGDGVFIVDKDFKILPRLQMHLLSNGAGQDNPTLL